MNTTLENEFDKIRMQFSSIISNYPFTVIIIFIVIFLLFFINRFTPVLRVQKSVSRIQGYLNTEELRTDIYPISYWIKKGANNNYVSSKNADEVPQDGYPFIDYHIMSSAKSYLVQNKDYDFCSLRVLQSILLYGAKFVELDVFNAGFGESNSYPIVTYGEDVGQWKTSINSLSFEDCCNTVLQYGIQYYSRNFDNADPVFLYLNCHSLNPDTTNKMAEIVYKVFGNNLVDVKYCNAGKKISGEYNGIIYQSPTQFYNKVIIVSNIFGADNDNPSTPRFDEMVNISTNLKNGKKIFQAVSYGEMQNMNEFKNNNKMKQMSMVYDDSSGNELLNYNPIIPWMGGCQFVAMHFQNNDPNMLQYLKMFSLQYPEDPNTSGKKKVPPYFVNTSYRLKQKDKRMGKQFLEDSKKKSS